MSPSSPGTFPDDRPYRACSSSRRSPSSAPRPCSPIHDSQADCRCSAASSGRVFAARLFPATSSSSRSASRTFLRERAAVTVSRECVARSPAKPICSSCSSRGMRRREARDVERQLAARQDGLGRGVAPDAPTRRPRDAGDESRRRRLHDEALRRPRLRVRASRQRSVERRRDRLPRRHRRRPTGFPRRSRRARRVPHPRGELRRGTGIQRLRAERPNGRL